MNGPPSGPAPSPWRPSAPSAILPQSACLLWHPDKAAQPAQEHRSYTTSRGTIPRPQPERPSLPSDHATERRCRYPGLSGSIQAQRRLGGSAERVFRKRPQAASSHLQARIRCCRGRQGLARHWGCLSATGITKAAQRPLFGQWQSVLARRKAEPPGSSKIKAIPPPTGDALSLITPPSVAAHHPGLIGSV
jgi:hypothetical protein